MKARWSILIFALIGCLLACSDDAAPDPPDASIRDIQETEASVDSGSEPDSSSDLGEPGDLSTDIGPDADAGQITDCSLLDDFAPCGAGELCFEGSCVSFVETVIDADTSLSGLRDLNLTGGRVWVTYGKAEGLIIGASYGSILELENGVVKGDSHADIDGGYRGMAGPVALGDPRRLAQYQSSSWALAGPLADALALSETDAASTFASFNDVTYTHRCDDLSCIEYTDSYELLGISDTGEAIVRRCFHSKSIMDSSWGCNTDVAIPASHAVKKLFAIEGQGMLGKEYMLFALARKAVGYFSATTVLLKAELNGAWEFVEQGDIANNADLGSLTGIHGNSPDNIWIVGSYGFIAHWNGSKLTEFKDLFPYISGENKYNFSQVEVTSDRVYIVGSRRDKKCNGNVCDAKLGSIIVVHKLSDDHKDPSTYKVHQLSGRTCHTDRGQADSAYTSCASISMVDSAGDLLILDDEVYVVGTRWFNDGDGDYSRGTIWHAPLSAP